MKKYVVKINNGWLSKEGRPSLTNNIKKAYIFFTLYDADIALENAKKYGSFQDIYVDILKKEKNGCNSTT